MTNYDPANPMGDATRCPHCGAFARVTANDEMRFVCGVCGAPRIETRGMELSGRELDALKAAQAARRSRFLWRVGGIFAAALAGVDLFVAVLLALVLGTAGGITGFVFALPFLILTAVAFSKVRGKSAELTRAVNEAWKSAARDVVSRSKQGVTPEALAKVLPLSEAGAEALLTELSIEDAFESRITDEGKLIVSPTNVSLRIDAAEPAGKTVAADDPLEAKFAALEESMAEEEAAAAQAAPVKATKDQP